MGETQPTEQKNKQSGKPTYKRPRPVDPDIEAWAMMNGLNLPEPPSGFRVVQAATELDARLAPTMRLIGSTDEGTVKRAIDEINAARDTGGLSGFFNRIGDDGKQKMVRSVGRNSDQDSFTLVQFKKGRLDPDTYGISFSPPESLPGSVFLNKPNALLMSRETGVFIRYTDEFTDSLKAADLDGMVSALHETGHGMGFASEKEADGMILWAAAHTGKDLDKTLETIAGLRDIDSDIDHFVAGDVLWRMRHDLQTDPSFRKEIEGKSISEIHDIAHTRFVEPSDAQYGNTASISKSFNYAKERIDGYLAMATASDEASFTAARKHLDDMPVPRDLDRDGAVTLLRMQRSLEINTMPGANNGLSEAMPALRAANPKAFAEAQTYMKDYYGVDVQPPTPSAAPVTATPARNGPAVTLN